MSRAIRAISSAIAALGFLQVESGPLVGNSYHAERAGRHLPARGGPGSGETAVQA